MLPLSASADVRTSDDVIASEGLYAENSAWSLASEREYTQWLKLYMECYRKDNLVSGYEWWVGFDWIAASNGIIGGHANNPRSKPGISNATIRNLQNEVVLTLQAPVTLQSTGYHYGDTVALPVMLANWTFQGYPDWTTTAASSPAVVVWTATTTNGSVLTNGSQQLALGLIPQGQTGIVATPNITLPPLPPAGSRFQEATAPAIPPARVTITVTLQIGAAIEATNTWYLTAFPPAPPSPGGEGLGAAAAAPPRGPCGVQVFAAPHLLASARQICTNASPIPADFGRVKDAFVVLTDTLETGAAVAARALGGVAILFNPTVVGSFPICATSAVGYVPVPGKHIFAQSWWMQPGNVGTFVYNTSLTRATLGATTVAGTFMAMEWGSLIENANYYTLDSVVAPTVHVRSVPAEGVYGYAGGEYITQVHNNALVWEAAIPTPSTAATEAADGTMDTDGGGGGGGGVGRFIVSGLSIFDTNTGGIRAEPQAEYFFQSLLEHGMRLAVEGNALAAAAARVQSGEFNANSQTAAGSVAKAPELCPMIESYCKVGNEVACKAGANGAAPTICSGNFVMVTPANVAQNASGTPPFTLESVYVYMQPNDARNKDSEIVGVLYSSSTSSRGDVGKLAPGSLVASGSAVQPFTNWTFNGLVPVGKPEWIQLPMPPNVTLTTGTYWIGLMLSKDANCYGGAPATGPPSAGVGALDAYVGQPYGSGPPKAPAWTPGVATMAAYATFV